MDMDMAPPRGRRLVASVIDSTVTGLYNHEATL